MARLEMVKLIFQGFKFFRIPSLAADHQLDMVKLIFQGFQIIPVLPFLPQPDHQHTWQRVHPEITSVTQVQVDFYLKSLDFLILDDN